RTSTVVPGGCGCGTTGAALPPSTSSRAPCSLPGWRELSAKRETEAIEGSASPRKPRVETCSRSSRVAILLVACRATASGSSSAGMPLPLSRMRIRRTPPSSSSMSTRVAPASRAFSTSSFTTEAGRSTTSPAAIWLTRMSGRAWIGTSLRFRAMTPDDSSGEGAPRRGLFGRGGDLDRHRDGQALAGLDHVALEAVGGADAGHGHAVPGSDLAEGLAAGDDVLAAAAELALAGRVPGARRRLHREVVAHAVDDRRRQALAVLGIGQLALFVRVGDEAGFHQHRRHVRRAQHHEVGALDLRLVRLAHAL